MAGAIWILVRSSPPIAADHGVESDVGFASLDGVDGVDLYRHLRGALDKGLITAPDGGPLRMLVLTAYGNQMEQLRRAVAGPPSPDLVVMAQRMMRCSQWLTALVPSACSW